MGAIMDFNLYDDVRTFYNVTYDILMRHEAQNLIPLGNLIIGYEGKDKAGWRDPANWFMSTVSDSAGIQLTAIMTPPHNLTLYATDNVINEAALACLIGGLSETGFSVPGVMTENSLAERFAKLYANEKGTEYAIYKRQRIYELLEVSSEIKTVGEIRLTRESDLSFLPYWVEGFANDCFGTGFNVNVDAEQYRYFILTGKQYVLVVDGTPVSMARIAREMQTVCGVGQVYTPPYFRGRGYATSCVAALSRLILERGYKKCVLYTDLANPTSNSIYQKIGYKPICDSLEIRFI